MTSTTDAGRHFLMLGVLPVQPSTECSRSGTPVVDEEKPEGRGKWIHWLRDYAAQ